MSDTKISWTDKTWNPVTGCTKASMGCEHCYAAKMAVRLQSMGQVRYANGFEVTMHPEALDEPTHWVKPRLVFVCSMADLFHEDVTDEFIKQVFAVMNEATDHTFQVLTKRPERLLELAPEIEFSDNIWVGVTVEHANYVSRIDLLRQGPAATGFLSCEPLLGSLADVDLADIDWVIVGGESGPGARPMDLEWARELRNKCVMGGVRYFYKQAGAKQGKGSDVLDRYEWKQWPLVAYGSRPVGLFEGVKRIGLNPADGSYRVVPFFKDDSSDMTDDDITEMLAEAGAEAPTVVRLVLEQPGRVLAMDCEIPSNVHVGVRADGNGEAADQQLILSRFEAGEKFVVVGQAADVPSASLLYGIDYVLFDGGDAVRVCDL
jgi:protein gp37